jgi:hypothetical protein
MDRTYRTRAQAGAFAGRVPSAATGSDDDNGRQSVSQLGGYAVEVTDAASPHETAHTELGDDESQYAETDDSRAVDLGTSDNPGRNVNPFGGGGQASAFELKLVRQQIVRPGNKHLLTHLAGQNHDRAQPTRKSRLRQEAHIIDATVLSKDRDFLALVS